jgi:hypothetical protein
LLEEVLERCVVPVDAPDLLKALTGLQAACAEENVAARPLFAEIVTKLRALAPA